MHDNNQAATVRSDAAQENTIWGIAFWVKKNIDASRFSSSNDQLPSLADEILSENSSDARLGRLLKAIGGDSGDHADAMFRAVVYISRGYCRFSAVYPKQWLDMFRALVAELQESGDSESLEREFQLIAKHRLVVSETTDTSAREAAADLVAVS